MAQTPLAQIVRHCDALLRTAEIKDYDGAVNGLQVENTGTVTRIAAAVDASPATVRKAIAAGANLMIVHHGLFWGARQPWTGKNYELLRLLLDHNVAVSVRICRWMRIPSSVTTCNSVPRSASAS